MLASVQSSTLMGVDGTPVSVEVHASTGLPGFTIVGLPDASCREARDRVRAAILSSGHTWPQLRQTVNLAPTGLRKVGAGLDLAIAIGVLVASDQLPASALNYSYLGELGLDGSVRPVIGMVPLAGALEACELVVAERNAAEADVLGRHIVRPVATLAEVISCLRAEQPWTVHCPTEEDSPVALLDLAEVRSNAVGRFAIEVAAAGGHHLLMVGPPGAGKTMLAERMPSLLAPLDTEDAIAVTTVHSAAGEPLPPSGLIRTAPFRSPHHTISQVALVGGGSHALKPGEISLSHRGILFLDELGEFSGVALDCLRQPLEAGIVRISRAHASATMPAAFQLVASMNPCPCGFAGSASQMCRCSVAALGRYARRVSGPLLDRFDLRIRVEPADRSELLSAPDGEPSCRVAERVAAVRERSARRGVPANRHLTGAELAAHSRLDPSAVRLLESALASGRLSGRGLRRVRLVALTLDDLRGGDGTLDAEVVSQALALRSELRFGVPETVST